MHRSGEKKKVMISKGYLEAIIRRRTDNATAKRQKDKTTNNGRQNISQST